MFPKNTYRYIVFFVVVGWIIFSLLPTEGCIQERIGFLHWDTCPNTGFSIFLNTFIVLLYAASAYILVKTLDGTS